MKNNKELRSAYENVSLDYRAMDQIQKDIFQTSNSEKRDENDPDFLNDFWENYCPDDDGKGWIRE